MRGTSQERMLDAFYASLAGISGMVREVLDRAFAKARARLHMPALAWLNDLLVSRCQAQGWIARGCGFRVVAGNAFALMPAMRRRACHLTRAQAAADQALFAAFLPGAELALHAAVHGAKGCERAMLVEALDRLGRDDLRGPNRGYPPTWLI